MERALDPLDPELLRLALGGQEHLPSPEELSKLLTKAELALLIHKPEISEDLIAIGWYLHAIASSKYALRTYGIERQRAAFQVAGHIFDLLLQTHALDRLDRLKYCFAAQIAYLRSTLDPNALALYRREFGGDLGNIDLLSSFQEVALSCGVAFLGFDVRYVFQFTDSLRREVERLEQDWDVGTIFSTPFGSASGVAFSVRAMMSFLVYGNAVSLARARERLRMAIRAENSTEDQLSRWVAAHLLNLADDLNKASIWTALPPNVPPTVRRAFAMGHPPILTLWPPQLALFGSQEQEQHNPLSANVKRLFISMPTSAGKTLIAQLLVTAHLATERTSVCYVAPTRSLCREIQRSLEARLRFLGKEISASLPEGDWWDALLMDFKPEVEVMTPERLSYLIRTDSSRVLEHFGLFIFDEVHLIGEPNRGWTLEEDLTYLHYATQGKDHRIVLMSAAVGNQTHFNKWMGEDVLPHSSRWRGPRRLHAIWTTEADWSNPQRKPTRRKPTRSKGFSCREHYPLYGVLNTRISHTGEHYLLRTTEPIGELVFRVRPNGRREEKKDTSKSTPFYKTLIPVIQHLSRSGPVLVIESTRSQTVRMAKAIAESLEPVEQPEIQSLIKLIEDRLGSEYPLCQILEKGVAYHHGALPDEIRALIVESVSKGHLRFLVATTTLTEGINLPVHSVVIASQGFHTADGYQEYITGSKLLNAIGRAGRATKETEGIVVLARAAQFDPADFNRLDPDDSDIRVSSMLTTEAALDALAAFEELQRAAEDAVFQTATGEVSDFLAFVWFVASELEKMGKLPTQDRIRDVLEHSLAWVQLDPDAKERWLAAAALALLRYQETDPSTRRRWAAAGAAISSASEMENIARELATSLQYAEIPQDPVKVLDLLTDEGRLERILQLPEAPRRKVYTQRSSRNREEVIIPMRSLLRQWVQGADLVTLAANFFKGVPDIDFRFEQLGDIIYDYFEIYLPRAFGTIISWTNSILEEWGAASLLPTAIPANVRWGVDSPAALELMVKGIRSRSLALRIARVWQSEEREGDIQSWLRSMSMADWQQMFKTSPADLRSILEFSRDRRDSIAVRVITQGSVEFEVDSYVADLVWSDASLMSIDTSGLSPIEIKVGENRVGHILARDQADVQDLLNTGLILSTRFAASSGQGFLKLKIVESKE